MINFTVGPVQTEEEIRAVLSNDIPYFRTAEFSKTMKENEELILEFLNAKKNSRVVFLTGSGTCGMEASVINTLTKEDNVLVVNGGSFGQRFVDILKIHEINHTEIKLNYGESLTEQRLSGYEGGGYTAFVVNMHETSTGVLYDLNMISSFCKRNGLFLIVDAISAFISDELDMGKMGVDVVIIGSQKALALSPGVSIVALSNTAIERVEKNSSRIMYMDIKRALKDGERGQTPFTPAVGVLLQLNARLNKIKAQGGIETERKKIKRLAEDFRSKIKGLPFEIFSSSMSNTVTPLKTNGVSAVKIFEILKNEYQIWVCPNGGELADSLFRVGHIGSLTLKDNQYLIDSLFDMKKRGLL